MSDGGSGCLDGDDERHLESADDVYQAKNCEGCTHSIEDVKDLVAVTAYHTQCLSARRYMQQQAKRSGQQEEFAQAMAKQPGMYACKLMDLHISDNDASYGKIRGARHRQAASELVREMCGFLQIAEVDRTHYFGEAASKQWFIREEGLNATDAQQSGMKPTMIPKLSAGCTLPQPRCSSFDWPLSREEKKSRVLRLYDADVQAANRQLQSGEETLEALRGQLKEIRRSSFGRSSSSADEEGTTSQLRHCYSSPSLGVAASQEDFHWDAVENAAAALGKILGKSAGSDDEHPIGDCPDMSTVAKPRDSETVRPRARSEGIIYYESPVQRTRRVSFADRLDHDSDSYSERELRDTSCTQDSRRPSREKKSGKNMQNNDRSPRDPSVLTKSASTSSLPDCIDAHETVQGACSDSAAGDPCGRSRRDSTKARDSDQTSAAAEYRNVHAPRTWRAAASYAEPHADGRRASRSHGGRARRSQMPERAHACERAEDKQVVYFHAAPEHLGRSISTKKLVARKGKGFGDASQAQSFSIVAQASSRIVTSIAVPTPSVPPHCTAEADESLPKLAWKPSLRTTFRNSLPAGSLANSPYVPQGASQPAMTPFVPPASTLTDPVETPGRKTQVAVPAAGPGTPVRRRRYSQQAGPWLSNQRSSTASDYQ